MRWSNRPVYLSLVLGVAGCGEDAGVIGPPDGDGTIVFLTHAVDANGGMEALFEGVVEMDDSGCLRVGATGDRATVIWPFGSELRLDGPALVVTEPKSEAVYPIGTEVTFGGGIVPDAEGLVELTGAELEGMLQRCPGEFWLVHPGTIRR